MVLNDLRIFLLESFQVLPVLLLSFIFYLGMFTSNIGLLMTVLGCIVLVPMILTLCSTDLADPKDFFWSNPSIFKIAQYILLPYILFTIFTTGTAAIVNDSDSYSNSRYPYIAYIGLALVWVLPFIKGGMAPWHAINPGRWFFKAEVSEQDKGKEQTCALLPVKEGERVVDDPSYWTTYSIFLLSFLLSNAVALHTHPAPVPTSATSAASQETIKKNVESRKNITLLSILIICLSICFVLYYRFFIKNCDIGIYNWFDLLVIGYIGYLWYTIMTVTCGIRSTDIFGIATTFLPPTLSEQPIVCTA